MDKRGNLQNVGYPVFFTPGAIAKLSFICDGEVTFIPSTEPTSNYLHLITCIGMPLLLKLNQLASKPIPLKTSPSL